MIPVADDLRLWRERERRTRVAAWDMSDSHCRDSLLAIADSYARMAAMAERRNAWYRQRAAPTFTWKPTGPAAAGVTATVILLILWYVGW